MEETSSLSSLRAFLRPALATGLLLGGFVVVFVALLLFQFQFESEEIVDDGGGGEIIDKRLLDDPFFRTARLFAAPPAYPVSLRFFDPDQPAPPNGLTAISSADGGAVSLRWDVASLPSDAEVVISRAQKAIEPAIALATIPAKLGSYIDNQPPAETLLVYTLATKSATGKISAGTDPVEVTAHDTIPPPPPRDIIMRNQAGGVSIKWTNPTVADFGSVSIYRSRVGQGAFGALIAANIVTGNYFDKDVVSGTHYWYTLVSVDKQGNESPAAPAAESGGNSNPFAEQAAPAGSSAFTAEKNAL